jgi:hypothetical protein
LFDENCQVDAGNEQDAYKVENSAGDNQVAHF